MSPCAPYADLIVLLSDGELSGDAAAEVRKHLDGCEGCRRRHEELDRLAAMLRPERSADAEARVPDLAEARFWRRFEVDLARRIARAETPYWRLRLVVPVPVAAAVVFALALLSAGSVVSHRRAEALATRNGALEASIRAIAEESLFGFSPEVERALIALELPPSKTDGAAPKWLPNPRFPARSGLGPAAGIGAGDLVAGSRPLLGPSGSGPRPIRFVDTDGMVAADLY